MKNITLKENKTKMKNMKNLKQIIKEEIKNILKEETPTPSIKQPSIKQSSIITTISKDLEDQKSNFANLRQRETILQLLDTIANKLGPKTIESTAFKQAVLAFYKKHK